MKPLVSVIMPAYNAQSYIEEAIGSVLRQSYQFLEIVIVDDASVDNTCDIVRKYCKYHKNIKLIVHKENLGAAPARQRAIEEATGSYLAFLDSDDVWEPDKLERQVEWMQKHKCYFTCTNYKKIDENGKPLNRVIQGKNIWTYADLLKGCPGNSTIVFNRMHYGKIQIPKLRKRNDYILWLQLAKQYNLYCIPEVLGYHRQRSGSISSKKVDLVKYHYHIYTHYEGLHPIQATYYLCFWIGRGVRLKAISNLEMVMTWIQTGWGGLK